MTSEANQSPSLLVLAAGLGSRYGGLKQLEQIGPSGETLMDYSIHDAQQAGFTRVVFLIREEMREQFEQQVGVSMTEFWMSIMHTKIKMIYPLVLPVRPKGSVPGERVMRSGLQEKP